MAPLDAGPSLPDISSDQPAGENLEFDADFIELERLAQGKPEQQYGATIVPAEEPDWKAVAAAAAALTERTHDLRVLALLAVGRLHSEGAVAYAAVLAQVRDLLETRWGPVHPQLDPDDDNDPTLRANALLLLAEPVRVMRFLRQMPLARSPRTGSVCWRDVQISTGALEVPEDAPKLTEPAIAGTFRDTDPAALAVLREAVGSAASSAAAIPAVFDREAGHGTGPDFTDLQRLLREIAAVIDRYAVRTAPEAEAVAGDDAAAPSAPDAGPAPVRAAAPAFSIATMGPPTNRADALRLLDLVIEFYERNEPSSPLPLLIARARRLAEMSFMDILRDMAPDGVSQAERLAGTQGGGY